MLGHKGKSGWTGTGSFVLKLASRGVPPYMGYIGMCHGIGYGFRGSHRVSFLPMLA